MQYLYNICHICKCIVQFCYLLPIRPKIRPKKWLFTHLNGSSGPMRKSPMGEMGLMDEALSPECKKAGLTAWRMRWQRFLSLNGWTTGGFWGPQFTCP